LHQLLNIDTHFLVRGDADDDDDDDYHGDDDDDDDDDDDEEGVYMTYKT